MGVKLRLPEQEIIQEYVEGKTTTELAHTYGTNATRIRRILERHKIGLTDEERRSRWERARLHQRPPPTPEEIAERAAEVREHWSDEDYKRAEVGRSQEPYTFPKTRVVTRQVGRGPGEFNPSSE